MKTMTGVTLALVMLAACSNERAEMDGEPAMDPQDLPVIGTDLVAPMDNAFCAFVPADAENDDTGPYVLVTTVGDNAYHGYVSLDGEAVKLTEVEAGFGAGMETRRFVDEDESLELEAILLDGGDVDDRAVYTGSIRVIYPAEGEAVKFKGGCRLSGG